MNKRSKRTLKDLICGFVRVIRIAQRLFDGGRSGGTSIGQLA